MYRLDLRRKTIIYTALLTFVCIMVFGLSMGITVSGDIRSIGFTGAGGGIGVLVGATASLFIHRDHEAEMFASWIITAPLMYGISKTACHVSGCCVGIKYDGFGAISYEGENFSRFPVQATEAALFTLIFLIGLAIMLFSNKPLMTSTITLILSIAAKFSMDYLRASHYESKYALSENQILALVCGFIGIGIIILIDRFLKKQRGKINGQ
jgi:hypothetical protein